MGAELLNSEGNLLSPRVDLQKFAFVRAISEPILIGNKKIIKVKPYWRKSRGKFKIGWLEIDLLKKAFEN